MICADGGTGRREGLKIPWPKGRAGSIPALRTTVKQGSDTLWERRFFYPKVV